MDKVKTESKSWSQFIKVGYESRNNLNYWKEIICDKYFPVFKYVGNSKTE